MKEYFASPDAGLYGLLFFFTFFIVMLIWLFRPGNKDRYKSYGDIPLKDDKHE